MKTDFWNSIAVNGLLLALVSIIFMLLQTILPSWHWVFTLAKIVTTISVLYFFIKQYSKEHEYFSYGDGFRYGFGVSFCSAIVFAVYVYVHYTYIFPESAETFKEAMMQAMQRFNNAEGLDLDVLINNLPVIMCFSMFFYAVIWGLIIPAILAGFTKKEQPPFMDADDDEED
jgi:hypothetical protein